MTLAGTEERHHDLAQLNVGRLVASDDAPEVAEFMAALDRINALAERSPGFVWRFQTAEGNAIAERPEGEDDLLVNFSTWASIEALKDYVFASEHVHYLRRRREWFVPTREVITVLWWVPRDHRPDTAEAMDRLRLLRENGPGPQAFTFRRRFDADGLLIP